MLSKYFNDGMKPDNDFPELVMFHSKRLDEKIWEDESRFPRIIVWQSLQTKVSPLQAYYFHIGIGPGGKKSDPKGSKELNFALL